MKRDTRTTEEIISDRIRFLMNSGWTYKEAYAQAYKELGRKERGRH